MIHDTHGKKSPIDLIRRKSLDALDYPDVQAAVVANTTFPMAEELGEGNCAGLHGAGGRGDSSVRRVTGWRTSKSLATPT